MLTQKPTHLSSTNRTRTESMKNRTEPNRIERDRTEQVRIVSKIGKKEKRKKHDRDDFYCCWYKYIIRIQDTNIIQSILPRQSSSILDGIDVLIMKKASSVWNRYNKHQDTLTFPVFLNICQKYNPSQAHIYLLLLSG